MLCGNVAVLDAEYTWRFRMGKETRQRLDARIIQLSRHKLSRPWYELHTSQSDFGTAAGRCNPKGAADVLRAISRTHGNLHTPLALLVAMLSCVEAEVP
jgi:hypothetical protein